MTVAIIGATGKMGSAIARSLSGSSDLNLLLMAHDKEKLADLKAKLEGSDAAVYTMGSAKDACWEADIVVVATPFEAEGDVAEEIRDVATGKIIISISNPLNNDYSALVTSFDTSAAEELQKLLPFSKVVKAFNTTFAADFETPVIEGKTADAFIAGDDLSAVETVSKLVGVAGFNPVVAGDLSVSRTLERMQLLMIQLAVRNNYNWVAGWKILHN